jgi:YrbI family 3-deoxy-D-manno-octulosonate 8-phosphate phosphatase
MTGEPGPIAVIPARGGSKRVPGKNLLPLAGLPLVAHTIHHALAARSVEEVIVSTDDAEIAAVARGYGADVVERPPELASDEATSESALLHVLDERAGRGLSDPELVVFLQCTSPVRRKDDIDGAVETLRAGGFDSLFSACATHALVWERAGGEVRPVNWDHTRRLREQDRAPQLIENGSIYVFRPEILREHGNRLAGLIGVYEMDVWSSFQIDTPDDVALVEWILKRPGYAPPIDWPDQLELVVFDFDGVMTDNTLVVTDSGAEAVTSHRGDGWGIARLREAGMPMLVLSTETNPVVSARCEKLGIPCEQDVGDKASFLAEHLARNGIDATHVAYVGNDENDLGCLALVGLPVVVADAEPVAVAAAKLVLSRPGGRGAVREFCDLVLARIGRSAATIADVPR